MNKNMGEEAIMHPFIKKNLLLLSGIFLFLLSGCERNNNDIVKTYNATLNKIEDVVKDMKIPNDNSDKSMEDLLEYLSHDFKISNKVPRIYSLVGAIDGCGISIDGFPVEIYKFGEAGTVSGDTLEKIKATGTMPFLMIDMPVEVNGSFVLASHTRHPDRDRLVNVFSKF